MRVGVKDQLCWSALGVKREEFSGLTDFVGSVVS